MDSRHTLDYDTNKPNDLNAMNACTHTNTTRARHTRDTDSPRHGHTQGVVYSQQWRPPMVHFPQAHTAFAPPQVSTPAPAPADYPAPCPSMMGAWDQACLIAALNQMVGHRDSPWVLDTGATSHMSSNDGILLSRLSHSPSFITVGNGNSIPISCRGTSSIPIADYLFQLNNVLIAPHLVRNLLSIR